MSVATAVHELLELRKALESQHQDAETVLDILEQASKAQVTPHLLHQTSLGRTVALLKKSQHERVSQRAKEIVLAWKSVVLTETPSLVHASSAKSLSRTSSASSTALFKTSSCLSVASPSISSPSSHSASSPTSFSSPARSASCPKLSSSKSDNAITLIKRTPSSSSSKLSATPTRTSANSKTTFSSSSKLTIINNSTATPLTSSSSLPITSSLPPVSFAAPDPKPPASAVDPNVNHLQNHPNSNSSTFSQVIAEQQNSVASRLSEAIMSLDEPELYRHDSSAVFKLNSTDNKVRNKLQELVHKAMGEANDLVKVELAVRLEAALFTKHAGCNAEYREHSRELLANLRDPNNPMLRFHLLSGAWTVEELVQKSVYDLAGDDLKKQRQEDAAWMDGWRRADWQQANRPKGGCDLFKCAKCGARDTTWTQKQTRSADEPMTTFVLCNNCGKRWRMC